MSLSSQNVDLDAIRGTLAAEVVLLLMPTSHDHLRVVARSGGPDDFPTEVVAPHGSVLARMVSARRSGRVPRLPLLSGTPSRGRPLGPSLVVPFVHPELGDAVLVVSRRQAARPFDDGDLDRAFRLAESLASPPQGITLLDLDALGGDATFRAAFEVSAAGMSLVDPGLRYRWVNTPLCQMLGRTRGGLVGTSVTDSVHPDHVGRALSFYGRLGRHDAGAVRDRLRFLRPDGGAVWADVGGSVVTTPTRSLLYVVQQFDVTAYQDVADDLAFRAMHDDMTGLANRALLRDRLQALLARAGRGGTRAVVFYLDIDRFKEVNDTWGHAAGDAVLTETARRLSSVVRAGDTVARYGGDEFVVAGEASGAADAALLARRIGVALRPDVDVGGRTIPLSVSVGFALSRPLDEPDDLVARADAVLLEAKRVRLLHVVGDGDVTHAAGGRGGAARAGGLTSVISLNGDGTDEPDA